MAFIYIERKESKPMFISDRNLYLTVDKSQVVEEGDSRSAYLLVAKGSALDEGTARRYGLISEPVGLQTVDLVEAFEVTPLPAEEGEVIEDESKSLDSPPENKAIEPALENK